MFYDKYKEDLLLYLGDKEIAGLDIEQIICVLRALPDIFELLRECTQVSMIDDFTQILGKIKNFLSPPAPVP